MPATAGRVRMPANNRVHSSAALQTHGIWQSAIGYDPYAPNKDEKKNNSTQKTSSSIAEPDPEPENAYASFQGLLALARITGSNADEARGACKKCGRVGHLTFQCRNFLSIKDDADREGKDPGSIQAAVLSGLEKLKGERVRSKGKTSMESEESSEEEEEDSESSDSDYDSEIERAIAEKYGKRVSSKKSRKRSGCDNSSEDYRESGKKERRRERGRSKKRSGPKRENVNGSSDEEEGRRKRRKDDKRRRSDDDSLDEDEDRKRRRRKSRKEKRRRRSHRYTDDESSDDSIKERNKRRSRRAHSDSDVSGSDDDSRVGRDKKRSGKKKRGHRRDED
ncbi:CAX-interacting protein 4 [Striga hermonthica]|uniref:CAX-interacting protein 4 n=1 Tax=Striga hermonthica TaxID=68872 RepID=A0A9N7NN55_STRHE|nr:CAX-interacting protein 4 [Striga hermonthica]